MKSFVFVDGSFKNGDFGIGVALRYHDDVEGRVELEFSSGGCLPPGETAGDAVSEALAKL